MSKTFSNTSGNRDIRVIGSSERGFIIRAIDHAGARSVAVTFNNDTAPALALAILEMAGVESPYYNLKDAVANLRDHVEDQERITAKARELAELEAEALELYKAHTGYTHAKSLSETAAPDRWLAVARKAREMRAKK